jgi:hypothetical protein
VATGNYTFTAQVQDSTSATVSKAFTLSVYANLGDNCANLSFNVPSTSTPITALTDLGTGTYQGSQGGLYPNGSNVRPAPHDADGVAFAQGIQPLDANGNPSPTGKYVLLAIGESTAQNEFNRQESEPRDRQRSAGRSHAKVVCGLEFVLLVDNLE